ncbi:MAG: hypothetical protein IPL23_23805 [Saprospiraceae bacterium]|nr:hypothetical protein [Saprospiraceae bacterium]
MKGSLALRAVDGVGKTTMLLQYIKEHYHLDTKALFLALDDLYFTENDLIDLSKSLFPKVANICLLMKSIKEKLVNCLKTNT